MRLSHPLSLGRLTLWEQKAGGSNPPVPITLCADPGIG
jgi:hypothetical protein